MDVRFSQDELGVAWADSKVPALYKKLKEDSKATSYKAKKFSIYELTRSKPLPAFRDIEGTVRIHDRHHRFRSFSSFMGQGKNFPVFVHIEKDYTRPNQATGKPWTESEMMADLKKNNYVYLSYTENPTFADLQAITPDIFSIRDSATRSLIGFVFSKFEVPLKSEDFTSKVQLLLIAKADRQGIDLRQESDDSWLTDKDVANLILGSPPLLVFLLENISPKVSEARRKEITDFFDKKLVKAQQKNPWIPNGEDDITYYFD